MADRAAQSIVDQAVTLARTHSHAPALEVLDLAMTGQHGSDPNFETRATTFDDWTDPASPFGMLLARAFGADAANHEVLDRFARRYGLWGG